jgi:hypothetical protein
MHDSRFTENPFYILGLAPQATRAEIEREGQKLLGQLELGVASARVYRVPGSRNELEIEHERTPERVREALATLRDSAKRLRAELWVSAPETETRETETDTANPRSWPEALRSSRVG